jgi:PAS domain S-box-containing protein
MGQRGHLFLPSIALESLSDIAYREYVLGRLDRLNAIFQAAAQGDFSQDIDMPSSQDAFYELYAGLQMMIEVVRGKIAQLDALDKQALKTVDERAAQLDRSQLQSVVDNVPNIIQMLDTELRYTFINRVAAGIKMSDYIGKEFGASMPDRKEVARIHAIMRKVLADGKTREYEYRAPVHGKMLWYKSSVGSVMDGGKATGLVAITFDITADRRANEDLRRQKVAVELSRQRDRALLNSIGEGLVVIDEKGRIANINASAAKMLGFSRKELVGKWFTSTVPAYTDKSRPIEPLDRPSIRALATGKPVSTRAQYRRKDGSMFPVSLTISPVVFDGKPIGVIEVFRDITSDARLDRAKEEFVSLASHQLRTPATGVKAYLSMMLDGYTGELTAEQREYLQRSFDSNERQLEVINSILDVARLDAGRIQPELATCSLNQLVEEVVEEAQVAVRQRQQLLSAKLPAKAVQVHVDRRLMHMVIENILSNASKYTPEGGKIDVQVKADRSTALIRVADTGVGIAAEDQPRLFQRFSRIHNNLSAARGGTGLGLYLARQLVGLHKGSLTVASTIGEGTTLTIELPLPAVPDSPTKQDA